MTNRKSILSHSLERRGAPETSRKMMIMSLADLYAMSWSNLSVGLNVVADKLK
jgi:hypothetical protein